MSDGETVLLCPHCLNSNLKVVGGWMGTKYLCKDCGYQGALVLEVDEGDAPDLD